jgi:hypothetical protein
MTSPRPINGDQKCATNIESPEILEELVHSVQYIEKRQFRAGFSSRYLRDTRLDNQSGKYSTRSYTGSREDRLSRRRYGYRTARSGRPRADFASSARTRRRARSAARARVRGAGGGGWTLLGVLARGWSGLSAEPGARTRPRADFAFCARAPQHAHSGMRA